MVAPVAGGSSLFSSIMGGAGMISSFFGGKKSSKKAGAMSQLIENALAHAMDFEKRQESLWREYEEPLYKAAMLTAQKLHPKRERNEELGLDIEHENAEGVRPIMKELRDTAGKVDSTADWLADFDASQGRAADVVAREAASLGLDVSGGDFVSAMRDSERKAAAQRAGGLNKVRMQDRTNNRAEQMAVATMNPAVPGSGLTRPGTSSQAPNYTGIVSGMQGQQSYYQGQSDSAAKSFGAGAEAFKPLADFLGKKVGLPSFASGGLVKEPRMVSGPGTGTSDSVPAAITDSHGVTHEARLSTGEFVIPADQTRAIAEQRGGPGRKTAEQVESIVREFLAEHVGGLQRMRLV